MTYLTVCRDAIYMYSVPAENETTKGREEDERKQLLGDYVLVKQPKKTWSKDYKPLFYIVYSIQGSQITDSHVTYG